MANQKLNIDIVARDKSRQALTGVQKSLSRVKGAVFNLRTAFLGLGAGLVIRNLVNTGKQLENLRVRLKFLLKDTNEGAKAFDNMTKFASRVPFSLEQIQSGAGILATVTDNADDLQNMLEITGNVAAVTGLDFRTASEQIQRSFSAGIGAADLFREKGVRNMLGFKAGATVSIEETVAAFEKVFGKGGRFGNSTDDLAKTFEGTISMIGDKIFNFKKVLLEAGFFDELKSQFGNLDQFLQNNAKDLDRIATAVGKNLAQGMLRVVEIGKDLIPTLRQIGSILKSIIDGFMALPPFIQQTGIVGAVLFGKRGFAALAGVSFVVDKINTMIKGLKTSMGFFDENNLEDVQLRIEQIKKQIENLKTEEDLLGVEGGAVNSPALENLLKELKLLEEKEEHIKKLQILENAGFSIARENQIIRNSTFKEEVELNKTIFRQIEDLNNTALENLKNKFKDIKTTIAEGINGGITKFSNSLARAIILGEDLGKSFKKMVADALVNTLALLIEVVIRMGIQKILGIDLERGENRRLNIARRYTQELKIQVALAALLAVLTGGGSMAGGGGFSSPNPHKASGGAVRKGQPYMVGEQGAELFIPNETGQITQSARGGGNSGAVNVNFHINAVNAAGIDQLLIERRGTISRIINESVNERGRGAII
tara:strand:+ start:234 stop:2198 length:1965 start_codon:yes stop_codon:yes gene_type:complete